MIFFAAVALLLSGSLVILVVGLVAHWNTRRMLRTVATPLPDPDPSLARNRANRPPLTPPSEGIDLQFRLVMWSSIGGASIALGLLLFGVSFLLDGPG